MTSEVRTSDLLLRLLCGVRDGFEIFASEEFLVTLQPAQVGRELARHSRQDEDLALVDPNLLCGVLGNLGEVGTDEDDFRRRELEAMREFVGRVGRVRGRDDEPGRFTAKDERRVQGRVGSKDEDSLAPLESEVRVARCELEREVAQLRKRRLGARWAIDQGDGVRVIVRVRRAEDEVEDAARVHSRYRFKGTLVDRHGV